MIRECVTITAISVSWKPDRKCPDTGADGCPSASDGGKNAAGFGNRTGGENTEFGNRTG